MEYNKPIELMPFAVPKTRKGCMQNGVAHLMRKYTPQEQIDVFWSGIAITADDNQCWLWKRHCDTLGYGRALFKTKQQNVHRIMWMLVYGEIPDTLEVCHSCDVRHCCNPKHLFLGTHQENMDDRNRKGRTAHNGNEKNGQCKLTDIQVNEIRKRYSAGGISQRTLAAEYRVTQTTIYHIVNFVSRIYTAS